MSTTFVPDCVYNIILLIVVVVIVIFIIVVVIIIIIIMIQSTLDYLHIPDHIKSLVKSLYTDFKTSILTKEFRTPFISVGRGVLQGDCLRPLLFNLCFNTFLKQQV